ncbi:hypothetical protein, partial [Methylobacterium crusticola]|uniref:hypothetical protein n=1 Tax=Methylobacterium crusticola TaxID=1697972 RepID=UPI001EE19AFC
CTGSRSLRFLRVSAQRRSRSVKLPLVVPDSGSTALQGGRDTPLSRRELLQISARFTKHTTDLSQNLLLR